ncbi:MAG: hypothetical protein HJJLKODD_02483 [Phycisphaerae bacterium]|nr:hypothetical protein [Phycisphaerae bacterium]
MDDKALGLAMRQIYFVERCIQEVEYFFAVRTDQVMMALQFGIVTGGDAGMAGFGDHAQVDQRLQYPINRGAGNVRQSAMGQIIDFVSTGVITMIQHTLQNGTPLYSQRYAALSTKLFQVLQALPG